MANRQELLQRRRRRVEDLRQDDLDTVVREALHRVHQDERGARRPTIVTLRPDFVHAKALGALPPTSQLLLSRGIAMRFYLLAVFERQCRKGPGGAAGGTRVLSHGQGNVSWVDMVAVDAEGQRRTKEYRTALDNRIRQMKGALSTLEQIGMVQVHRVAGTKHYAGFELMRETGRGDLATPNAYTVPKANEATLHIPIEFWLNGWIHVLQPSEIATWLMFRHLAQKYYNHHARDGVYIYGDDRKATYGIKRDAYEAHAMLSTLGLLERLDGLTVNNDLTITIHPERDKYEPHHFQVTDDGLKALAVPKILEVLDERLAREAQRSA